MVLSLEVGASLIAYSFYNEHSQELEWHTVTVFTNPNKQERRQEVQMQHGMQMLTMTNQWSLIDNFKIWKCEN